MEPPSSEDEMNPAEDWKYEFSSGSDNTKMLTCLESVPELPQVAGKSLAEVKTR